MMMRRFLPLAVLPLLLGAGGDARLFVLPIACKIGSDCAIQNYVDVEPGAGVKDYRCGGRTYADHGGIDFRLTGMAAQRRGVAVLAAADGTILRLRDNVPDISVREAGRGAAVEDIMCGNGVVIGHSGGFETQYCHMAQGSIPVKRGDTVKAGAPIGRVGLSGNTEYPHLHFTVHKYGATVEPFAYGARPGQCGGGRSLWAASAGLDAAYRAGEILNAGFAAGPVTLAAVLADGAAPLPRPTRGGPALVAFVQAIGLQGGDIQRLTLAAPDGSVLADNRAAPLDRDKAQWVIFTGKKRPAAGWPAGRYSAHYVVMRAGRPVIDRSFAMRL